MLEFGTFVRAVNDRTCKMERYRAVPNGRTMRNHGRHGLAARPAGKFQFVSLLDEADMHNKEIDN